MIAHVIPLLRLPRRFRHFDYISPTPISPGDLVVIPFKGRETFGVVTSTASTSEEPRLKSITRIETLGVLTPADIERLLQLSELTAQSAGSLFALAAPTPHEGTPTWAKPIAKASADARRIARVQAIMETTSSAESSAVQATTDEAMLLTLALRKSTKGQILILVPRERDAELLANTVPLGERVAVITGKTSERQRSVIARAWREGTVKTLIGTRQAALFAARALDVVIIFETGNEEHRNDRRNPRFDARDAARLLANQHGARLVLVDALPRPEDVHRAEASYWPEWPTVRLIDMVQRQERSDIPLLSSTLLEELKNALQSEKKVLLLFNRKGVAKRLQCKVCNHLPLCGTCGNMPTVRVDDLACERCGAEMWIPKACPACGSPKLGLRGVGGAKLEADLTTAFPEARVTRIEKGHADASGDIILATEYYFSSVARPFGERYSLVAEVMADVGLIGNDFRSAEKVARRIHRLRALAEESDGTCIVQTFTRDAIEPLCDGKHFTANELATRSSYRLPPFTTIITMTDGGNVKRQRLEASDVISALRTTDALPDTTTVIVDNPLVDSPTS